jgi:hypothetical protein
MTKYDSLTGHIINSLYVAKQFVKENEPDLLPKIEAIYNAYVEFDEIMAYGKSEYDAGGYLEVMGPNLFYSVELLKQVWDDWKQGTETEPEMVRFAKKDVLDYIASKLG